jgi:acetyl esterase/lipase
VVTAVAVGYRLSRPTGPPDLVGTLHSYTYCNNGGISETLEVYEPTRPIRFAPILVDIHGGGWVSGDADLQPQTVDWRVESTLVAKGWVFASINYRLAPSSPWPAQIEDAKCAIRFVRAHAQLLRINPERIGVMGASAGGQLAAMLGLTGNRALFGTSDYSTQSSSVEAVVDEYGPTDLTAPAMVDAKGMHFFTEQTFGIGAGQDAPVLEEASPVTYVHQGAPPFLVIQGANDQVVPPSQSTELVDRLAHAGDHPKLLMVRHAGHGLVQAGDGPITPSVSALAADTATFLIGQLSPS